MKAHTALTVILAFVSGGAMREAITRPSGPTIAVGVITLGVFLHRYLIEAP